MNWKYVKPLKSKKLIKNFESKFNYKFPNSFISIVNKYNGGRPEKALFDTYMFNQRAIKSLLSFNEGDKETMWKISEWNKSELNNEYISFAIDNFGNLICFSIEDNSVVFLELESLNVEKIADDFDTFINNLYSK